MATDTTHSPHTLLVHGDAGIDADSGAADDQAFAFIGTAEFSAPGQVRFELLVDHGGTPSDPSDDEFLESLELDIDIRIDSVTFRSTN